MAEKKPSDLLDESDRGCVLVGAAILEQRLEDIFRQLFAQNKISNKLQNTIFDSNGPLSTFSSKIKLAYSLGYVTKSVFDDLETVRKIRNDFAHTPNQVEFIGSAVSKTIESMHCVQEFNGKLKRYSPTNPPTSNAIPQETLLRTIGYVKHTKSLFAFGVKNLEIELCNSLLGIVGTTHQNLGSSLAVKHPA